MEEKNQRAPVVINLSAASEVPAYPKTTLQKDKWITFGPKNQFPQDLIRINSRSPVNAAIIESTVTYICGKGVRDSAKNAGNYVGRPNPKQNWDKIIEPLARDFKMFGGFYFQVIKSKKGNTFSLYHQDFSTVRIGLINDKGHPTSWRISNDWSKTGGKNAPVEIEAWPGAKDAKPGKAYLYHYWTYSPGLPRYCVPDWFPAMQYVEADGALGEFYNNAIDNGFAPSAIITMPSNPSDAEKEAFEQNLKATFTGAKGVNNMIVIYGESTGLAATVAPFSASANADIFNNVEGIVFQKIISGHRLASPTLAGVSGNGNLSGNAAEIIDGYVLYNYTVVEKLRRPLLDALNEFQTINGKAALAIDELDVLPKIRETEQSANAPTTGTATLTRKTGVRSLLSKLKQLLSWK